jgi:hypothetical protein
MSSLVSFWGTQITEGTFGAFLAIEVAVGLEFISKFNLNDSFQLGVLAMITIKAEVLPPITLTRHNSAAAKESPVKRRSSLIPSETFKTPIRKAANPIFGTPSLVSHLTTTNKADEEMDWMPQTNSNRFEDDAFTLRPGRLSTDPTGLESLLEGTSLINEPSTMLKRGESQTKPRSNSDVLSWIQSQDTLVMGGVVVTIAILLMGAVLPTWQRQKGALWDPSWDWSHFDETPQAPTVEALPLDDWANAEAT